MTLPSGSEGSSSGSSAWLSVLAYGLALVAGIVLICSGKATVPEASGYVAPFLLLYERSSMRRSADSQETLVGGGGV